MNELFEKQGNSIHTFKKGDVITRVKKASFKQRAHNDNLMIMVDAGTREDGSFIGDPLRYIGIHNNQIWLEKILDKCDFSSDYYRLDLDGWSEDWAIFELPEGVGFDDL